MQDTDASVITIHVVRGDSRTGKPYEATTVVNGKAYRTTGDCYGGDRFLYRLLTLLTYDGDQGRPFEVRDDRSPTGGPSGLAMTGRVRSYLKADLIRERLFSRDNLGTRAMPRNEALEAAA